MSEGNLFCILKIWMGNCATRLLQSPRLPYCRIYTFLDGIAEFFRKRLLSLFLCLGIGSIVSAKCQSASDSDRYF